MRNRRPLASECIPEAFDASGAFETCRVKAGKVLQLEGHLHRLAASLQSLGIPFGEKENVREELKRAARGVEDGSVRIAVRRTEDAKVILHERQGIPYSKEQIARGISLVTAATRQPSVLAVPAQAKRSERLDGILARWEGRDSKEVLRFGSYGTLTEGTVSNLFLVKQGRIITPPIWVGVLEGVTRAQVLQAARRQKIPVQETPVTRHDLFNADEAFLTNVLMEILPIREVDGRRIGTQVPGPITRRLLRAIGKVVG